MKTALWFAIQAAARSEFKTLCAGSRSRLKCVYHSLTMAAASIMVAAMGHAAARMPVRAVLGVEALGAAVMALMFASLSA